MTKWRVWIVATRTRLVGILDHHPVAILNGEDRRQCKCAFDPLSDLLYDFIVQYALRKGTFLPSKNFTRVSFCILFKKESCQYVHSEKKW